jgi:hypothetical protein
MFKCATLSSTFWRKRGIYCTAELSFSIPCWYEVWASIATRYRLGCPGTESRWRRDFPHPSRPALGLSPSLLYNGYRVFPGVKAARAWQWPPTQSSSEVKERVEIYLYSTFGPLWPVVEWTLPLLIGTVSRCANDVAASWLYVFN